MSVENLDGMRSRIAAMSRLAPRLAAEYLGVAYSTLAKWRLQGYGPQYIKVGERRVVYQVSDLDQWLQARRRTSTSDHGAD